MGTMVRMLVSISGTRDGQDWPARGGLLEVADVEAAALVAGGLAEAIVPEPGAVETASLDTRPAARGGRKGGAA